jgi:hypothetical protein
MEKQLLDLNVEQVRNLIEHLEMSNLNETDKETIRQMIQLLAGSLNEFNALN